MNRKAKAYGVRRVTLAIFFCMVPLLMGATGGCQAFSDTFLSAIEAAAIAAVDAALANLFDNVGGNSNN